MALGAGRTYGEVTARDAGNRDSAEAARTTTRSAISAMLLVAMAVATTHHKLLEVA